MTNLEITEIELSERFITIYGRNHADLLKFSETLWFKLGKNCQAYNRQYFAHIADDPLIFHPYGNPDVVGHDPYRHFHIINGNEHLPKVLEIIEKELGQTAIPYTSLEDRIPDSVENPAALKQQSNQLLDLWLEHRTDTITELVDLLKKP